MEVLRHDVLSNVIRDSGVENIEKIKETISTVEISLARQAAKTGERSVILDEKSLPELRESLRIGADIGALQAEIIMSRLKDLIEQQTGKEVALDEDVIEIGKGVTLKVAKHNK